MGGEYLDSQIKSVTNHVSALLGYWDRDLVCRFANDTYSNWFGKKREDMVNKMTMRELVGPVLYEKNLPHILGALNGVPQTFERELPMLSGAGCRFTLANYIPDIADGVVKDFFVHIADVTAIKLMENELIASNNLVKEQNKRLLNFANIVTHNLKSYANNLGLILELFIQADSETEKSEMLNFLKDISTGFSLTLSHLSEIVDAQNNSTPRLEQINLHDYIDRAVDTQKIDIKSTNATIHNNVDQDLTVMSNPAYVDSIILNLLTNSIKYRRPGIAPIIEFDACATDKELVLTIKDNGRGIDIKKHKDDLFGMYKTFHGNPDAKGVGLFLVRSQVEAMGGRIELESEVDKGTTFHIYFKLYQVH